MSEREFERVGDVEPDYTGVNAPIPAPQESGTPHPYAAFRGDHKLGEVADTEEAVESVTGQSQAATDDLPEGAVRDPKTGEIYTREELEAAEERMHSTRDPYRDMGGGIPPRE